MKTLIIVRHAKAEPHSAAANDFNRSLTAKGKQTAMNMANFLAKCFHQPDVFISSDAKRAYSTAKRFAGAFQVNESDIKKEHRIYEASTHTLLQIIQNIDNKYQSAIMFGHNPGFSEVVSFLIPTVSLAMPTSGICIIGFDISSWHQVGYQTGELLFFKSPDMD